MDEVDTQLPRRRFLQWTGAFGFAAVAPLPEAPKGKAFPTPPAFPWSDPALVQSVVGASHSDLERVRSLVSERPSLAKASWDWGFGDWETALGAASHTGRREIAEFLIAHGARPTLFSSAMLGNLLAVQAMLEADPALFGLHGPHGLSLTRHAQAGGADAQAVVDYLLDRFGPDETTLGAVGDSSAESRYGGDFLFDTDPPITFKVVVRRDLLFMGAGEANSRVLEVEKDVYHPTGAPAVRFRFHMAGDRATALTIEDGPFGMTGQRA